MQGQSERGDDGVTEQKKKTRRTQKKSRGDQQSLDQIMRSRMKLFYEMLTPSDDESQEFVIARGIHTVSIASSVGLASSIDLTWFLMVLYDKLSIMWGLNDDEMANTYPWPIQHIDTQEATAK